MRVTINGCDLNVEVMGPEDGPVLIAHHGGGGIGSLAEPKSTFDPLADRFRVVIFPVITGATGQERIFDGYPDVRLDLVEAQTFDDRSQLLEYIPTVLDGPPGA